MPGAAGGHHRRRAHWHFAGAPDVLLFYGAGDLLTQASRVSGVVFANSRDGRLYGPGLYATHDGGAHWRRISLGRNIVPLPGGGVTAMAASAGTAGAVVDPDPFHGLADELYRSPVGTNAWARADTMTAAQAVFAVSGRAAWFANSTGTGSGEYVWATADGVHWNKYPFSCPGAYCQPAGIAPVSPSHVLFLCAFPQGVFQTEKEVLLSANGGRTGHLGEAPVRRDGQVADHRPRAGRAVADGQHDLPGDRAAGGDHLVGGSAEVADGEERGRGGLWGEGAHRDGGQGDLETEPGQGAAAP
jgi:hypothetical protein